MNNKGFTIIEVLVSVLIVMLAIILTASVTIHSLQNSKKINDLFYLHQKADNIKNDLLSRSYNSIELNTGERKTYEDGYIIKTVIEDKTTSLKKIRLIISKKQIKKEFMFLRSKYIN